MQHNEQEFLRAFNGRLIALRRWEDLARFWETLEQQPNGWYLYAVGESPPTAPIDAQRLHTFILEIDALLRRDHDEAYCGIVYADDHTHPTFVKIYDPNNLGASCGSSGVRVLPGWILSRVPPADLQAAFAPPANRRRWWQRLFT